MHYLIGLELDVLIVHDALPPTMYTIHHHTCLLCYNLALLELEQVLPELEQVLPELELV